MTTTPGADERRVRKMLFAQQGLAPDATLPAAPAGDWWERLYDETTEDHHGAVESKPAARRSRFRKAEPEPATEPEWVDEAEPDDESTPEAVRRGRRSPSRLVQAEFAGLERRMQWLLSTAAGSGIGWAVGLEHLLHGWITDCAHDTTPTSGLILGLGLVAVGTYAAYRTRGWWPPLAWACRIPFATALLALCLYAPGVAP